MNLNHIEAIIFDAEGVVVHTEMLWDKSQEVLLARRGLQYDREYLKPRMAGQTLLEGAQLMIEYYGLDERAGDIARERDELIRALFDEEIPFVDGYASFAKMLSSSPVRTAIATAMDKALMAKVERQLHLKEFFGDHIYFIADVDNKSKPAPDVFLHAAEKLGVKPENCIVIEDAPYGIEAARRAGMYAIGLTTTFSADHLLNADFVANDFMQIRDHLLEKGMAIS